MLLQDWLTLKDLTYGQFGIAISRTAEAVRRYANGERIPDRDTMKAIARETAFAVTPNDFYDLPLHAETGSAGQRGSSPGKTDDFAAPESEAA